MIILLHTYLTSELFLPDYFFTGEYHRIRKQKSYKEVMQLIVDNIYEFVKDRESKEDILKKIVNFMKKEKLVP